MFLAFLFLLQLFTEGVLGKLYLLETEDAKDKKESRTENRSAAAAVGTDRELFKRTKDKASDLGIRL